MSESTTSTPVAATRLIFAVDPQASFRRGVPCPTPPKVAIEVDPAMLSDEERDLIASHLVATGEVTSNRAPFELVTADEPTVAGLIAAVRRDVAKGEAIAAQEAANVAARLDRARVWLAHASVQQADAGTGSNWHSGLKRYVRYQRHAISSGVEFFESHYHDVLALPEYVALQAEVERLNAAEFAAAVAAEEAEQRRREQEQESWIAAHGSARLKRLVAEGIGWSKTYESERNKYEESQFAAALAAERPGWYEVQEGDLDRDLADVSSRALALLDAGRQIDPEATLARVKASGKYVIVAEFRGRVIAWPAA